MPRLAANLSMMYNEHDFLQRFAAAAKDGFRGVEFLFPYAHPAAQIRSRLEEGGLTLALFNTPPGDEKLDERGTASIPGREDEFRRGLDLAMEYAQALGNRNVHVMAGKVAPGHDRARYREAYLKNLAYAAAQAGSIGVTAVIEPINTRDIPGFFLNRQDEAHAIVQEVGSPHLKVQMDLYHCQIVEGDVATKIRRYIANVAHMQVAGVPQRHEPDLGEVNYPYLFEVIDELGYDGWIGCEYRPRAGTTQGLGWARPYLGK